MPPKLSTYDERRQLRQLPRKELSKLQLSKLNTLLGEILPANEFYAQKFAGLNYPLRNLSELTAWPFTTKDELAATPQAGRLAVNQTYETDRYARFHQTSGTRGRPQIVLETTDDWEWWMEIWQHVFD